RYDVRTRPCRGQTSVGTDSIALNLAAKAWFFPTLAPIDLLARFDLDFGVWPSALFQKTLDPSDLIGAQLRATAKLNYNPVESRLSHAVFGKIGKRLQLFSACKGGIIDCPRCPLQDSIAGPDNDALFEQAGRRHGQGSSGRVQRWGDCDYHHDYGAGVKGAARLRLGGANDS